MSHGAVEDVLPYAPDLHRVTVADRVDQARSAGLSDLPEGMVSMTERKHEDSPVCGDPNLCESDGLLRLICSRFAAVSLRSPLRDPLLRADAFGLFLNAATMGVGLLGADSATGDFEEIFSDHAFTSGEMIFLGRPGRGGFASLRAASSITSRASSITIPLRPHGDLEMPLSRRSRPRRN